MESFRARTSCRRLIVALLASSALGFCAISSSIARSPSASTWPIPSTPAALPQPDPAFTGKIGHTYKDSTPAWPKPVTAPAGAPNVVIILIDDAGFAATNLFGGPVATPNLDKFAKQGLRYNDFNVTGICSPTRAQLLTGRNHHRVGFGNVTEVASGFPGYNMIWKKSTASVAEVLRDNGYSTAAFGKWHNTPYWEMTPAGPFGHWPTGLGFQHFYGFMGGEDSEYQPRLFNDTTSVAPPKTPAQGYYFTTDITNKAIDWIHTHEALVPNQPYFLYFATGATHAPHQVQRAWVEKYKGQFKEGWDKLREKIFARQKALGVIPANTDLTPRPKVLPAWNSLSKDEKLVAVRQMEVYAGYMAETDHQVGRLIKAIQSEPDGANTLIFYIVGDNGASGEGGVEGSDHNMAMMGLTTPIAEQLKNLNALGGPTLDNHYAAAWAWALDTPFKWMKQIASNFGATRDPMVVVWPKRVKDTGQLRTQFTDVNDVVPTIYQVAGITPPKTVDGVKQQPMDGTSFAYTFAHPDVPSRHRVQYYEIMGNRGIYDNGWVASARHGVPWANLFSNNESFRKDHWKLFHVTDDFSEAHNLANKYPLKLAALKKVFDTQARKNDVFPLGGGGVGSVPPYAPYMGRKQFVFYPSLPLTPTNALPIFMMGPYRITAKLELTQKPANGTIISYGSRFGGFTLYAKNGNLIYDNNHGGFYNEVISATKALPDGATTVTLDYIPNLRRPFIKPDGTAQLYINGKLVGQKEIHPTWYCYFGSLGIGRSGDSPISSGYNGKFPFSGTLKTVTVDLGKGI